MKISQHRLTEHWFAQTEDIGAELVNPRFIVMHYTAGAAGAGSRDYMMLSPAQKQARRGASEKIYASAHLVIDRDGSIWQIAPFNRMTRHAGTSSWRGLTSLNQYSIGIEIANYGWLDRQGDGSYKRSDTKRFAAQDVMVAAMPGSSEIKGWENYTAEQLQAVEQVTQALLAHYPSIVEIVGHQDISPGRKFDPGPAFPMRRFQNLLDSRGVGAPGGRSKPPSPVTLDFAANTSLNIRGGPGTQFDKLDISPLRAGTVFRRLEEQAPWMLVELLDRPGVRGWVHQQYVRLLDGIEQQEQSLTTATHAGSEVGIKLKTLEGKPGIVSVFVSDLMTGVRQEIVLHNGTGRYQAVADGRAHLLALYATQMESDEFTVEVTLSVAQPPHTLVVGVDLNPSSNPARGAKIPVPFDMTRDAPNGTVKFAVEAQS